MISYDVIVRPIVTERTNEESENKRYTFKVDKRANKTQIKIAVEDIFKVQVKKVNTMNMQGKLKRQGKTSGRRPDWKKAIVTLKDSSPSIKIFES